MLAEEQAIVSDTHYVVVDAENAAERPRLPARPHQPACPVIGVHPVTSNDTHPLVDVWAQDDDDLALLTNAIDAQPIAAGMLVQLLRHNARATLEDGLFAESLSYSSLQQSTGFRAWRDGDTRAKPRPLTQDPVLLERSDADLTITLNRPDAHNAYCTEMRDALVDGLHLAYADQTIERVLLRGKGPSFCSGGDLSEFGAVTDAGLAHLSRTTRSAGRLLANLACETQVLVHGACIGAGIEVPAFADQITASEDAFFQLPEVAFGLVPGAGGTVSVTKRIGRERTAWMALSGQRIDVETAHRWGLVDELV